MAIDKKNAKRNYKENPPMIGVYLIKNKVNNKCFVGSSTNIPGIFNRIKFELKLKVHRNPKLMADWLEFGEENFTFEILDEIKPNENPNYNYADDLAVLVNLWLEQLPPCEYM